MSTLFPEHAPAPAKAKPQMWGTRALKDRGWTEAGITRFLGEPDERKQHPFYKSQPPARLYLIARVEAAEATDEWQQWRAEAEVRQERGRKQAEARKAALVERVASRRIDVPVLAHDDLARLAVEHRNMVQMERAERFDNWDDYMPMVHGTLPLPLLKRLAVNYLRHECTDYDSDLDRLHGRVGRQEAAAMVRRTVLDAIADAYPTLADECERQR